MRPAAINLEAPMENAGIKFEKKLLETHDVLRKMAISRSTLDRRVAGGAIPGPIKFGERNYWLESEIDGLIDELAANRDRSKSVSKCGSRAER